MTKPQRAPRQSRNEGSPRERRLRGDTDLSGLLQLGVDTTKLDQENYVYRWINEGDNGHRLQQSFRMDWDVCRSSDYSSLDGIDPDKLGTAERRPVGKQKSGSPEFAYLCRKYRPWYEADQAKKHEQSEARMRSIKRGVVDAGPEAAGLTEAESYIPDEGISIRS